MGNMFAYHTDQDKNKTMSSRRKKKDNTKALLKGTINKS